MNEIRVKTIMKAAGSVVLAIIASANSLDDAIKKYPRHFLGSVEDIF